MRLEHVGIVHPVKLIAREDQHVLDVGLLKIADVLPDGVGRALIPIAAVERLLGGEDFDEPAAVSVERVRAADMAMQTHGIELREHVDPVQSTVDAI